LTLHLKHMFLFFRRNLLAQYTYKTKALCNCLIVVGSQESLNYLEDFRACNFVAELNGDQFEHPNTKVCEVLSIHAKVNNCIEKFISVD